MPRLLYANVILGFIHKENAAHSLKCFQCALCFATVLPQGQNGFEDGLSRVHGPVKLVVHIPPEPWHRVQSTQSYR